MNEHRGYSIDRKSAVPAEGPPTPAISRDELLVPINTIGLADAVLPTPIDESLAPSAEPETADLTEIAAEAVAEPPSSTADLPPDDPLPGVLPGDYNLI